MWVLSVVHIFPETLHHSNKSKGTATGCRVKNSGSRVQGPEFTAGLGLIFKSS